MATAAAVMVGVMVTGCGGATPTTAPTSLPAIEPTASISPANQPTTPHTTGPPESPKQLELAAATATVRHYFSALNKLHNSMDADSLASLFTASCPCQAQVRAVIKARRADEHFVDHARVKSLRPTYENAVRASVLATYISVRGGLVNASGRRLTTTTPDKHVKWLFSLGRFHHRWRIVSIDNIP